MARASTFEVIEYVRSLEAKGIKVIHAYAIQDRFGLNADSLKVLLWRVSKRGLINRIGKNWIALPDAQPHKILPLLYPPSYASMEWALSYHGVSMQKPFMVTAVSTRKTKKIKSNAWNIEIHHVADRLFFGFDERYIACPEKALLDLAYIRNGIDVELDLSEVNKRILRSYLMKYPRFVERALKNYF